MQKILAFCLLAAVLIGGAKPCSTEVAPASLEKLIKVSRLAVIGKVIRIIDVEGEDSRGRSAQADER